MRVLCILSLWIRFTLFCHNSYDMWRWKVLKLDREKNIEECCSFHFRRMHKKFVVHIQNTSFISISLITHTCKHEFYTLLVESQFQIKCLIRCLCVRWWPLATYDQSVNACVHNVHFGSCGRVSHSNSKKRSTNHKLETVSVWWLN